MDILTVTLVGGRYQTDIESVISKFDVNSINDVNNGKLGNFTTLTYRININEGDALTARRNLIDYIDVDGRYVVMFDASSWMHIYVFERRAFKDT